MQEQPLSDNLYNKALKQLQQLINIPSFSKEESHAAAFMESIFTEQQIPVERKGNNIWVKNKHFNSQKPTLLLNSHLDTVKPNTAYTRNPFEATIEDGKIYGLGSNDAGASLLCLLAAFIHYYPELNLKYNLIYAATAEEEISGTNGIELIIEDLGNIDAAIVGEPTQMHLAIAEKGLLVLDCVAQGKAGHAAREEGDNAIYKALEDIEWFRTFRFPKKSVTLGEIKMSVTWIQAGTQHNVVPAECRYTVDIRCTDAYTHKELLDIIQANVRSDIHPRSLRLQPSSIAPNHPLVLAGIKLGRKTYGSPTTSDQALIPFPSVKIGPGDSARSHQADEFIFLHEIKEGIDLYIKILDQLII